MDVAQEPLELGDLLSPHVVEHLEHRDVGPQIPFLPGARLEPRADPLSRHPHVHDVVLPEPRSPRWHLMRRRCPCLDRYGGSPRWGACAIRPRQATVKNMRSSLPTQAITGSVAFLDASPVLLRLVAFVGCGARSIQGRAGSQNPPQTSLGGRTRSPLLASSGTRERWSMLGPSTP